jgi:hypothetical protein
MDKGRLIKQSTFKLWNVYSSVFIEEDQIFGQVDRHHSTAHSYTSFSVKAIFVKKKSKH